MTREELEKALTECEGHTPGEWEATEQGPLSDGHRIFARTLYIGWIGGSDNSTRENSANAHLIALAPALASALGEAWEEIDRLKAETVDPSLDEALNSGTGDYKP